MMVTLSTASLVLTYHLYFLDEAVDNDHHRRPSTSAHRERKKTMVPKDEHDDHAAISNAVLKETSTTAIDDDIDVHGNARSSRSSPNISDGGGFYYLSDDARRKLPNYQYRGSDLSLLYKYVLSPISQWLVDNITPMSMAPNTITSIGLIWMITSYLVYWYYVPSLNCSDYFSFSDDQADKQYDDSSSSSLSSTQQQFPRWIFLWNGIAMLAYQTLDNMDGKQARRTQSSSPLGLLFDHGCDAINSIFGSANWIIGMNLDPAIDTWQCWALVFGPFAMFYISTWEQYYTGELILPLMNGPNEGLLGGALLSLTSFLYGNDFWQRTDWWDSVLSTTTTTMMKSQVLLPSFFEQYMTSIMPALISIQLRNCDFVIIASCVGFVQEIVLKSIFVTRRYRESGTALIPFVVLAVGFWFVGYVEPTIWLDLPRTSLHLAMLLFVEQVTDLMVAHVTDQPFCAYRWQLAPLVGLVFWVVLIGGDGNRKNQEENSSGFYVQYWIMAYTWCLAGYLTMKFVLMIHEICQVLEIHCFDIVTPYDRRKTKNEHSLRRVKEE